VERIGDYRAEIERVVPLEVRRGRFEELDREQEWGANVVKSDGESGRMVVEVESVREVDEKVGKSSLRSQEDRTNGWFEKVNKTADVCKGSVELMSDKYLEKENELLRLENHKLQKDIEYYFFKYQELKLIGDV
jgi:hypothetical protein